MRFLTNLLLLLLLLPAACASQTNKPHRPVPEKKVLAGMKRAGKFMVETVSYKGGYVWSYLPDLSRRWGEMEAWESMIWVQPPGTATMGHLFLDAYHATGDEYYYRAADKAARALAAGQHPSGGWDYLIDFAGEESLKEWYATIGTNGWRLEEFHHYYGNATFDDAGTSESAKLLSRIYLERRDSTIKAALDKAIGFVLDSQYPMGGWPQRYPPPEGKPDYTSFITFNDDVAKENIRFLILCYTALGDSSLLGPIRRAMDAFVITQMPEPQPGWAMQYTPGLKPAEARSYEPAALSTSATESNIRQLMDFYRYTGDEKYLSGIPLALDWLESLALPPHLVKDGRTHPLFVERETNKTLYLHRRGSNVVNGEYFVNYDPEHTVAHYRSTRYIDVAGLRREYEALVEMPKQQAMEGSPLEAKVPGELPRYFSFRQVKSGDLNSRQLSRATATAETVKKILSGLNEEGYWPTTLRVTTYPYKGPGPAAVTPGDYRSTFVGDEYDTSPFYTDTPQMGISIKVFINNMATLIEYLLTIKN